MRQANTNSANDPQHDYADREDEGYTPYQPKADPTVTQEHTYRGPKPPVPPLSPDPREFSKMKIALDNILPSDATERFKFQILTDHLKCEEASLVADSYSNSRQPYTDTMVALTKMYGQPHKLAVQRIAGLMMVQMFRAVMWEPVCFSGTFSSGHTRTASRTAPTSRDASTL